jgi:hypothetical protein
LHVFAEEPILLLSFPGVPILLHIFP